jgi:hypothetical protein
MSKVQVVLVEWMGYPIFRKKPIDDYVIKCGIGHILNGMKLYDSGVDFECTIIVNEYDLPKRNKLIDWLCGFDLFRPLFFNNIHTNSKEKYKEYFSSFPFVNKILFRENQNQDIGAYDYFISLLRESGHKGDVVFINSSCRGPEEKEWLEKYKKLFYKNKETGISGISINSHHISEFYPHVQSFLIYTNMSVLDSVFPFGFLGENGSKQLDKKDLIELGELGISKSILDSGYGISCSSFPEFYYKKGFDWDMPEGDVRYLKKYNHLTNKI